MNNTKKQIAEQIRSIAKYYGPKFNLPEDATTNQILDKMATNLRTRVTDSEPSCIEAVWLLQETAKLVDVDDIINNHL